MRNGSRAWDELRELTVQRDFIEGAPGAVLIGTGRTKVLCTASIEEGVPPFRKDSGLGWLTAEYSMLPMATPTRNRREASRGRIGGRTHEIQRLIGRSLRAVTDFEMLGENTVHIDCDVIQADGGTRTAAITGSFIALVDALKRWKEKGVISSLPVRDYVSAVSVGIVGGDVLLDLDYAEDSSADVDMNVVMTGRGKLIEVQGTAEHETFTREELHQMLDAASSGIAMLTERQRELLGPIA